LGDPGQTGKSDLEDLRDGKATVLMAHALRSADGRQARSLQALVGNPRLDHEGAQILRNLLHDTGAVSQVEEMITERARHARHALALPHAVRTAATLHALRRTAAFRMAEDPSLPLTDVQAVLGHAQLPTTRIYTTPRTEDVIRRVLAHHGEQERQAATRSVPPPAAGLPARDAGRAVRDQRAVTVDAKAQAAVPSAVRLNARPARQRGTPRAPGSRPRPDPGEWSATRLGHDAVVSLITRLPFTAPNPGTRNMQVRSVNLALDWLAGQPGGAWQQQWLARGAEDRGGDWKQDCAGWMDARGAPARQGWTCCRSA
jgi:hypothetical protein